MKKLFISLFPVSLLLSSFPLLAEIETETITTRIVGGEESDSGEWPAMVSIKDKLHNYHFCGGSLIAQQWVVTAAHCMYDDGNLLSASDITATVGEYDLYSSPITPPANIELILVHKDYDPTTQVNDIALLKLAEPVTNESISITSLTSTNELIAQQAPATVIGWGSTVSYAPDKTVQPDYPYILNEAEISLYTDQQCSDSLGTNYTNTMLCAGVPGGGKDACQGDSGGPLMVNTNDGWQQIGIVSWGYGCATPEYPGVYTRLAIYDDWIKFLENKYTTFSIPVSVEFSQIPVGESETQLITVDNYSYNEANFTYEFAGSEYFSFDASGCETIAAHSSCEFTVTYTPLSNGSHTATITINTDDIADAIPQELKLYREAKSSSSGSLGVLTLLLLPLLFMRRLNSAINSKFKLW